jgi:hypothetical protein
MTYAVKNELFKWNAWSINYFKSSNSEKEKNYDYFEVLKFS